MRKLMEFTKKHWFLIAVILLIMIKQWLICRLPIYARDEVGVDEWKMLKKTEDLLSGNYWEDYTAETMFKRDIFFPVFLALCHLCNISYWSGCSLVYTVSCLLSMYSFSHFCKNKAVLLGAFILMLFSPVSYGGHLQLVYNLSLVSPFAIGMISCMMLAFHDRTVLTKCCAWNILAGIFGCMLWLNREDTQWLLLLISGYILIFFICTREFKEKKKILGCVMLPAVFIFLGNNVYCCLNNIHYGLWVTNDHIATGFADAYNSLLKIVPDSYPESCSITRDMISKAAKESPAFGELYDWLDVFYEQNEGMMLAGRAPDDGEIEDGWMPFVLRNAASEKGYYESAESADTYWKKVSQELEMAFSEGRLEKRNIFLFGSVLKHPWVRNQNYFQRWMSSWIELMTGNIRHNFISMNLEYSTISTDIIKQYEAITYNNAVELPVNGQNNDPREADALCKLRKLARINQIYQKLSGFEIAIIIFTYISLWMLFVRGIIKKITNVKVLELLIFMTAIIGCVFVYTLALGYIDAFMFGSAWYSIPVTGLIDFLAALSVVSLSALIYDWRKEKINDGRIMFHHME